MCENRGALGRHGHGAALAVRTLDGYGLVVDGDDAPPHTLTKINVSVHVGLTQPRHVVADYCTHAKEGGDWIQTHLPVRESNVQRHVLF